MVGAGIAVSATLVASSTVSGFLIPATSLSATENGVDSLSIHIGSDDPAPGDLTRRVVRLPCYECAPNKDGDAELAFNFSLSLPDRTTLYFNDAVLFPSPETHDLSAAVISVDESVAEFEATEVAHSHIPIELRGPSMVRQVDVPGSAGMSLLQMTYGVVALRHGRNLHSSTIQIMLFRDPEGRMSIIRASAFNVDEEGMAVPVSGPEVADAPVVGPGDYVELGDRIRAKFEQLKAAMALTKEELKHAIDAVKLGHRPVLEAIEHGKHHLFKKPCSKHVKAGPIEISDEGHFPAHYGFDLKGGDESNIAPPPTDQSIEGGDRPVVHRPGHGRPLHGPHLFEHGRKHRFRAHVAAVVLHIFVPIVFGVLIGLTMYAIGVFVGGGIVWLWIRLVRGGRKNARYEELPAYDSDDEERYLDDPKMPTEAPPAYAEQWSRGEAVEKEVQADERPE